MIGPCECGSVSCATLRTILEVDRGASHENAVRLCSDCLTRLLIVGAEVTGMKPPTEEQLDDARRALLGKVSA